MRIILFIIGLALSLDGLYCGYIGSMGAGEGVIVAIGIAFLLWGSFYDAFKTKKFLRVLKRIFTALLAVCVLYSCVVCVMGRFDSDKGNEDYVIVLGSPLKDNEPTDVLKSRLDTAVKYLNGHPGVTAIVSGARSSRGETSEAVAMNDYLVLHGIDDKRILIDESSFNTHASFLNAAGVVNDSRTAFITSEFHVLRSLQMANLCGVQDAAHIGAPTPWVQLPACCAREILAEIASVRYYFN